MTLKWTAVIIAAVSLTLCVTANAVILVVDAPSLPDVANLLAIGAAGSATVVAVLAELHDRLDSRITALTEFLVARLNDLDQNAGDRNAGFVEGYLLSRGQDAAVVPIGPRLSGRRAMISGDE